MKPNIISFSIAIVLMQFAIQAQNFIDETKQWTILSIASMDTNVKSTHYCKFSGDSIINGSTYHKLYISNDSNQINWTFGGLWFERNDSIFKYCWHCGNYNDTTDLIYDFNIVQGDTFNLYDFQNMVVDSVRLIEWGGNNRKHWFFNQTGPDPYNCLTWIEGVGQFGNLNCSSPCLNSMFDQLLCFHENGNLIFQNSLYNSCYIATSSDLIKVNSEKSINIFQSENGQMIINNPNLEKGTIDFYSIEGRQINDLKIESENTQLDLKKTGMIIYKFTNLNGKTQTGKFLNVLP